MSATMQLTVYDALVNALKASPALADGHIKDMDSTNRPMPSDVDAQIRVSLDQSEPSYVIGGNAPVDWTTRVRVECTARSVSGGLSAFRAATALAGQVQGRVLADTTLQNMVEQVDPAPMQWAEDEADTSLVACQAIFNLVHRTAHADLTA